MARGLSGFFGIYGMWYSVRYLPLAEATVLSFLAPNVAGYLCARLLGDPFTRREPASAPKAASQSSTSDKLGAAAELSGLASNVVTTIHDAIHK